LDGRVAIVIGSATGIGAASARRLAEDGATVVLADVAAGVADTAAAIRESGAAASARQVDVRDEDGIRELVAHTVAEHGGLDILHNNAADTVAAGEEQGFGVTEVPTELWDRTLTVNLRGYMLGCKHAIPAMIERGGGSIINTSSVVSVAPLPIQAAYASSKGAINSLTLSVATTYGARGIRCNAVMPGMMLTEMARAQLDEEFLSQAQSVIPSLRLGSPEDIAAMVSFLASDDAGFVNGQVIAVDGGMITPNPMYRHITGLLSGV
jgi:NAD(P)-dependent dehydrogenase (short-subunit alcohol dehydrogenase family)